jgi:hypothetical protein
MCQIPFSTGLTGFSGFAFVFSIPGRNWENAILIAAEKDSLA